MPYEFKATRRVEFSDTDMAGIMHFSNFFRFMETAEHGFFRSLGHSIMLDGHVPPLGLPRVHASCDFKSPLRFDDLVEIHLLVREKKPKSLTYTFIFRKISGDRPVEVAHGTVTVVCVSRQPDGSLRAHAFPREIADQIEVAPAAAIS